MQAQLELFPADTAAPNEQQLALPLEHLHTHHPAPPEPSETITTQNLTLNK